MEELDSLANDTVFIVHLPPTSTDTLDRVFDINPGTVYGVLCLLLCVAIIWLAFDNRRKDFQLLKITSSTVSILKDLNTSLLLIKEELEDGTNELKDHIKNTREHISEKINQIKI